MRATASRATGKQKGDREKVRGKSSDPIDEELDDVDSADRIIVTDKGTFVCTPPPSFLHHFKHWIIAFTLKHSQNNVFSP